MYTCTHVLTLLLYTLVIPLMDIPTLRLVGSASCAEPSTDILARSDAGQGYAGIKKYTRVIKLINKKNL